MKTQNLVKELKRCNIRTAEYVRPPIGKDVFALSIQPRHREGVVMVNQGSAKVEVHGSKRLRQASVTVQENGRSVTRHITRTVIHNQQARPNRKAQVQYLRRSFPVVMPNESRWTTRNITMTNRVTKGLLRNPHNPGEGRYQDIVYWHIAGDVTAKVKGRTVNHFLIGMDETRNFISPLPQKATSVRQARALLKPDRRLRSGTKRQGEWFFIPCDKKMAAELDKIATEEQGRIRQITLGNTTHRAKSALDIPDTRFSIGRVPAKIYARGYITENRTGHHKALFLTNWHEVVKNKEAEIKVAPWQQEAMRRRRATFD